MTKNGIRVAFLAFWFAIGLGAMPATKAIALTGIALWMAITLFVVVYLLAVWFLSTLQVWLVARYATEVDRG